ncbi:MAG: cytochrome c [bacterium]|nr:cytochrome c [bacterium]
MKTLSNRKFLVVGSMMFIFALITMSFSVKFQDAKKKPWNAPDAAKKAKNPVAKNDESVAAGKALYMKHCKSCHGSKGLGDGPKSKELDTACGDFSAKETTDQTDGELFYKTKEGRDDMPSFKKKITDDEEIWSIINFMRTLAK